MPNADGTVIGWFYSASNFPTHSSACRRLPCHCVWPDSRKIVPGTQPWLRSAQLSPEPAHIQAVQQLGLTPLLAFDLTTGQGTGGVLALSALNAAIELVADEVYAITDAINAHNHGA